MCTVNWGGYEFGVYQHDANWNDVGGVYIFSGLNSRQQWAAIYIGQTDSFHSRIPSHEQWIRAMLLGATHVHAMVESQAAKRDQIERQLIAAYQPMLNVQLKQKSGS
jgi:excinuclease UvrABC nuclease subunit